MQFSCAKCKSYIVSYERIYEPILAGVCCFRTFRVIDDNRNRKIDREELEYGIREFGLEMSKAEVGQLFDFMDKDGSGSINFDEFLVAIRVNMYSK